VPVPIHDDDNVPGSSIVVILTPEQEGRHGVRTEFLKLWDNTRNLDLIENFNRTKGEFLTHHEITLVSPNPHQIKVNQIALPDASSPDPPPPGEPTQEQLEIAQTYRQGSDVPSWDEAIARASMEEEIMRAESPEPAPAPQGDPWRPLTPPRIVTGGGFFSRRKQSRRKKKHKRKHSRKRKYSKKRKYTRKRKYTKKRK